MNDFSPKKNGNFTEQIGGKQMIAEIANSQRVGYTASKIFHMYRMRENHTIKPTIFYWFITISTGI